MDIVERLRIRIHTSEDETALTDEAADEIERLRDKIERLQKRDGRIRILDGQIIARNAEIKRLREALQFYASKNNYEKKKVWTTTLPQYEPDGYNIVTPVLSDNGERARAALKEGE